MVLITGSVQAVSDSQLSLQVSKWYTRDLPRTGSLSVDIEAARLAIDRQRAALDAVRYRRAIRSDLGDLLVFPEHCATPESERPTSLFQKRIDEPKLDAVAAALGTKDFLIVEGPPGTGKTTFISELILQLVSKDPTQRILLTSQTHVALDNALENLLAFSEDYRIVRVGRSGNPLYGHRGEGRLTDRDCDRRLPVCPRRARSQESARWCCRRYRNRSHGDQRPVVALGFLNAIPPVRIQSFTSPRIEGPYVGSITNNTSPQSGVPRSFLGDVVLVIATDR
jgi:hypothetical protein